MQVFSLHLTLYPREHSCQNECSPSPAANNRVPFWNAASTSRKVLSEGGQWGLNCDFSSLCLLVLELQAAQKRQQNSLKTDLMLKDKSLSTGPNAENRKEALERQAEGRVSRGASGDVKCCCCPSHGSGQRNCWHQLPTHSSRALRPRCLPESSQHKTSGVRFMPHQRVRLGGGGQGGISAPAASDNPRGLMHRSPGRNLCEAASRVAKSALHAPRLRCSWQAENALNPGGAQVVTGVLAALFRVQ